jgi:hypothetical protein
MDTVLARLLRYLIRIRLGRHSESRVVTTGEPLYTGSELRVRLKSDHRRSAQSNNHVVEIASLCVRTKLYQHFQHHWMNDEKNAEHSTPWARQWYEDLEVLTRVNDARRIYEAVEANYASLFVDPHLVNDFALLDPTILRAVPSGRNTEVSAHDDPSLSSAPWICV